MAHTYKFETAILRINREIRREACDVLASNLFVVVSSKWPLLDSLKHHYDLPIITENQNLVTRFQTHSMRVHFHSSDASSSATSLH